MHTLQRRYTWNAGWLSALLILAVGHRSLSDDATSRLAQSVPAVRAVQKARCNAGDRVETALQGQTTLQERYGGASESGAYTCNLRLVGQIVGEGASWQMAAIDHCAYF